MSNAHIVIRLDRDDYRYIQSGYERLHLTTSQVIRLAVDRFLIEPEYRYDHPFALSRPVVNEDLDDIPVVSRMLWKFSGGALRACEGLVFQAARSRGIGSIG